MLSVLSWSTLFAVYFITGGVVAIALAGWELINRLQGYAGLPLRQYPIMMVFVAVTWLVSVPALMWRMHHMTTEGTSEDSIPES